MGGRCRDRVCTLCEGSSACPHKNHTVEKYGSHDAQGAPGLIRGPNRLHSQDATWICNVIKSPIEQHIESMGDGGCGSASLNENVYPPRGYFKAGALLSMAQEVELASMPSPARPKVLHPQSTQIYVVAKTVFLDCSLCHNETP